MDKRYTLDEVVKNVPSVPVSPRLPVPASPSGVCGTRASTLSFLGNYFPEVLGGQSGTLAFCNQSLIN